MNETITKVEEQSFIKVYCDERSYIVEVIRAGDVVSTSTFKTRWQAEKYAEAQAKALGCDWGTND